jgi:hypothetical protein
MSRFGFSFILSTLLTTTAIAEIRSSADDDVLAIISKKLNQIDNRLQDHRISVSSAKIDWKEWDQFKSDLIFTVAHDPHGPTNKELDLELTPTHLTQKLKDSWLALEISVREIEILTTDTEWVNLQTEMTNFFKLRDQFLYQPARAMVRSGLLTDKLEKIKQTASTFFKRGKENGEVSVKVIDPKIVEMTHELKKLNDSIQQLDELRNPPPAEVPTIYQAKYYQELFVFGFALLTSGCLLAFSFMWLKQKMVKKPETQAPVPPKNTFNYYEWLKRLESNLQALKNHEENTSEQYINLKAMAHQLNEARKNLNLADNQQDYYTSLECLNIAAPKIEEHFEKANVKKHSEATRRIISQIVQLCDAIENKKEMSFEDEKPKLKVIKLEQVHPYKVA